MSDSAGRNYWQQYRQFVGDEVNCSALLVASVTVQQLNVYFSDGRSLRYPISTALNGPGCQDGSGCTPTGWHHIADKIGSGEVPGRVFTGRRATEIIAADFCSNTDDDLITSRILWLDGLQPGLNRGGQVDSHHRYIYIHGTAQEHRLGEAVSHGCIRMANSDVIELFDQVAVGDPVLVRE